MIVYPWITTLTAIPVVGALLLLVIGERNKNLVRWLAIVFSFAALLLTLILWRHFDSASGSLQFQERYHWIPALSIEYHVGIDGLGLLMLLLSSIVVPIAIAASWKIQERVSLYFALVLLLQTCLFGTFTALNFVHWFTFWELSLIPAFFLIKLWGGPRRTSAATQFLVYTMVGSIAMLLAFLAIFLATKKFDFIELAQLAQSGQLMPAVIATLGWHHFIPQHVALMIFAGVFLGFAIKVPLIPFHTWLPSAYSEAPTGTTILLTGAMSKMGLYGFLRILFPIFGAQMQAVLTPLLWLAVATVVLSAYAALAQKDLKRIFAYSSINHLGYCLLGIFAVAKFTGGDMALTPEKYAAMNGVFLQMFNHGLTAATLFWFIAMLEQRSGGLRSLGDFGGLRKVAPVFTGLMGIALFSSLGLPGLNGFIGEFLIFKGSFPLVTWATALSVIGLMVTAIVILGIIQRVFSEPLNEKWLTFPDLTIGEWIVLVPAIGLMFLLGIYPQLILAFVNNTVIQMVQQLTF
ncbi:NADH-quinone oxidoreductase subunit M [Granulicella arctica]|uniref:NADH-quinone oxidoreductase subunit M n=1 Tax=Granulicella arctica TaxID=940613 RepID=UPI0015CA38FA